MNIFEKFSIVILPILLTAFFASIIPRKLKERFAFKQAAEQFRLAFWPEVEFLDKQFIVDRASVNVTRKSCDVLFDAVGRHQEAVFIFQDHLGCINKYRFKKTWQQYCEGGSDIKYFREEYPCENELQQSFSEEKALKRINAILKFAKPK